MNYLVGVCVFERRTDLAGEFNDLLEIVRRRLAQVGTIHQLHNKERKAVVLSHVVDGDNVWMIQRCSGARFAHETRALLGGRTFFRGTATVSNNARAIFLCVAFTFTRYPFPLFALSRSPFPFTRYPFPLFPCFLSAYILGKNLDCNRSQ